ncbi:coagulation factor XIII A chain-like [Pristis pectinata]|uniref:coagulation factor XIII A chain-like n=1 Tax=Pristis pectinata TaxID=685728 RepID=UPI00223E34C2|nr:coagulation factor XIII A chain-like [Pristis pectinata]
MSEPSTNNPNRRKPLTSYIGRQAIPSNYSNAEENAIPDFQYFGMTPRTPPNLQGFLEIWGVDMHPNPDDINKKQHHTELYNSNNLIVRRGQPFQITVTTNRPYKAEKDKLWIELLIGRYPNITKGTYIPIYIQEELERGKWGAKVKSVLGNNLSLTVLSPPDCIVGRFRVYVAIMTPVGIRRSVRDKTTDIYFIFNPWCEEDAVYLSDAAEREEYVLNDVGCIYYGKFEEITTRSWIFGQFESNILDACIYIMDRAQMPLQTRGCPIKVCRVASAMINSKDDDGVLVGNWSGQYENGVAPTAWNSSVEILLKYFETKWPVCYGQCWVFAAVLNTVLRCLGLPARVVTNFSSAHDNDANLSTDIILDPDGNKLVELTKDSIWNYHCWNEAWMTRSDLPPGYGGWQAVDATPQETSEGMYRCGPVSVKAIKQGKVFLPFDGPFVYAEVNSDVVYWTKQKDGSLTKGDVKTDEVGKLILTKEVGSDMRKNITDLYKYPEGSQEERLAQDTAIQYGIKKEEVVAELPKDVSVDIEVAKNVVVGTDFKISLKIRNNSNARRNLKIQLSGYVVFYTGVPKVQVTDETIEVEVEPNQVHQTTVQIKSEDYEDELVEQSTLEFLVTGHVVETGQNLVTQKVVTLQIPKLDITVEGEVAFGNEVTLTFQFTNPFQKPLEYLVLRIDGLDYLKPKLKLFSILPENGTLITKESVVLKKYGQWKVIASLDCTALRQVVGELQLNVQ